jgi:hypothetical protein
MQVLILTIIPILKSPISNDSDHESSHSEDSDSTSSESEDSDSDSNDNRQKYRKNHVVRPQIFRFPKGLTL